MNASRQPKAGNSIVIGILPQDQIRKRVLAIARGDYRPGPGEPKIWFTSMRSLAEVLSDDNRALLRVIAETGPESISALAQATGRKPGNLSRTLKTLSNYGIVDLIRKRNLVRPVVNATEFHIVLAAAADPAGKSGFGMLRSRRKSMPADLDVAALQGKP